MDTNGLLSPTVQREAMRLDHDLYRLSSLVDILRDNAKDLLELYANGVKSNTKLATGMVTRYTKLRTAVSVLLPADDRAFVSEWTVALDASADVDEVFDAASSLARAIDTLINTPAFVASRVKTRHEISGVLKECGVDDTLTVTSTDDPRPGQYL